MVVFDFGNDYEIDEDSNGDFVIRHDQNGEVLKYDESADKISTLKQLESLRTGRADIGTAYQNPEPSDGTVGIQSAHDALPSTGGVIHLQAGRYEVNHGEDPYDVPPVKITKPNVTIIGEGWESEIFLPDGEAEASSTTDGKGSRLIHDEGDSTNINPHDGTRLFHFVVNGNQQNNGGVGDGSQIGDLNDGHNIELTGKYNVVHNVKSINSTGDGVELISRQDPSACRYNIVSNCLFEANYEQDMHNHGAWDTVWVNNIAINEVQNSSIMCQSHKTDNKRVMFANNRILGSGTYGARLFNNNDTYNAEDIFFVNNLVSGNDLSGIWLGDSATGVYVLGNVIKNNGLNGIRVNTADNVHISGRNIITGNGRAGIKKIAGSGPLSRFYVINNQIGDNNQNGDGYDGIDIGVDGDTLENVRIADNDVNSTGTPKHNFGISFKVSGAEGTYNQVICERNHVSNVQAGNKIVDTTNSILKRDNPNVDDFVSFTPSSMPTTGGLWYLDDGTNTSSGTRGKRVYDGTSWVDAWTL